MALLKPFHLHKLSLEKHFQGKLMKEGSSMLSWIKSWFNHRWYKSQMQGDQRASVACHQQAVIYLGFLTFPYIKLLKNTCTIYMYYAFYFTDQNARKT